MTATSQVARDKALLAKQLREILDLALKSGLRQASIYIRRVKKYEYAKLLLPREICLALEGLRCDIVSVSESMVVYRCGAEGTYKVNKHKTICGLPIPIKKRGKVFVEFRDGYLTVYL